MSSFRRFFLSFLFLSGALIAATVVNPANAAEKLPPLHELIAAVVADHVRMKSAEADVDSADLDREAAADGWTADVSVSTSYGYEKQNNATSRDTSAPPREASLTVTQLLWDFGSTNATMDRAEMTFLQAGYTYEATRQSLILEAVTAYLDLARAKKIKGFAQGSVDNLKRQLDIENTRIERGAGVSTDRLQAKSQLAAALARFVQAEGTLHRARARYRAVFGEVPEPEARLPIPEPPVDAFPPALDDAIAVALDDNPQLLAALHAWFIAREDVNVSEANELRPTINFVVESNWKDDVAGTLGYEQEQSAIVELEYSFDVGLANVHRFDASQKRAISANNQYRQARLDIEEQVRNAWNDLKTARLNAEHLNDQADIAAEFLDRAREERLQGNRSLIDILAGETSLINARSDAASAETDVLIASFAVLAAIGKLDLSALE